MALNAGKTVYVDGLEEYPVIVAEAVHQAEDCDSAFGSQCAVEESDPEAASDAAEDNNGVAGVPEVDHEDVAGDEQGEDSDDTSSGTENDSPIGSDHDIPLVPAPEYPFTALGVSYTLEDFRHKTRPGRSHMRVKCTCLAGHHKCVKRRGIGAEMTSTLGPWELVAFLRAWSLNPGSHANKSSHVAWGTPSAAQTKDAFGELRAAGIIPG